MGLFDFLKQPPQQPEQPPPEDEPRLLETREKCAAYIDEKCGEPIAPLSPFMRGIFRDLMIELLFSNNRAVRYPFDDMIREERENYYPDAAGAMNILIKDIIAWLPPWMLSLENSAGTPLIDHIEKPASLVHNICIFSKAQYKQRPYDLFITTAHLIHLNLLSVIGISFDAYIYRTSGRQTFEDGKEVWLPAPGPAIKWKYPLDMAKKYEPQQLVTTYLKNTPFEKLLLMPVEKPVKYASPELRFSGTWVIANQGKGKTNLLRSIIRNRMKEDCSIIVFDSKPELSEELRSRQFPKETVTIDPDPYLALNALDLGTHSVATLMYLFSSLMESKLTPLQSGLFQNTLHLCTLIPDATFSTFRDIISNGPGKYPAALAQLDEEDTEFWNKSFAGGTYKSTREEILWRLNTLRPSGSIFRTMFNAPKTLVKMQPLMDTNTLTIINNSRALLDPIQSEFFARLFLVMILGAAEQRARMPENHRFPCFIIMDEAQTIISREPLLSDIIHRMRAMKIGLLCAHQSLSQLKDPLVESALDDCAIKFANNDHDAPALAQRFRTTTEHLQNLKVGTFAYWFQGQSEATTTSIPWEDLSAFPKLTTEAIALRNEEMRRRYCYTPETKPQAQIEPTGDPPDDPGTWGGKAVI